MACRDLTTFFRERRRAKHALNMLEEWTEENLSSLLDNSGCFDAGNNHVSMKTSHSLNLPRWVRVYKEVEAINDGMRTELRRMRSLRKQQSLVTFDQMKDFSLQTDLSALSTKLGSHLRTAQQLIQGNEPFGLLKSDSEAAAKVKSNARSQLTQHMRCISHQLQAFRQTDFDSCRCRAADSGKWRFADATLGADSASEIGRAPGHHNPLLSDIDSGHAFAEHRQRSVEQLASSVNQVANVYKEVAVMVIDQGTLLDRVDYNMELIAHCTRQATTELSHGYNRDDQAKPTRCLTSLLLLVALLMLSLMHKVLQR
mmetsp:Transcript_22085/g.69083  ORF Transcript_22085/g.69083 Transcript_22085/m.69083 type:complete len:313 (-) Transcript_22085:146-1084(-)